VSVSRRGFLAAAGAAAVAAFDPERALWVPGKRLISIPARRPVLRQFGADWLEFSWVASQDNLDAAIASIRANVEREAGAFARCLTPPLPAVGKFDLITLGPPVGGVPTRLIRTFSLGEGCVVTSLNVLVRCG